MKRIFYLLALLVWAIQGYAQTIDRHYNQLNSGVRGYEGFDQMAKEYFIRATSNMDKKYYWEAIDDFSRAIEFEPRYAEAYNNRGIAKRNVEDRNGAIDDFTLAIDIDPKYAEAFNNRGNAKLDLTDYAGAVDDYTNAINLDPRHAETYNNRGLARNSLHDKIGRAHV